jgi:hypothetical protein
LEVSVVAAEVRSPDDLVNAIQRLSGQQLNAVIVLQTSMLLSERQKIAALAAAMRIPMIYGYGVGDQSQSRQSAWPENTAIVPRPRRRGHRMTRRELVAAWCACAGMAFLIGIAALSIGTLLLLTQAEEPKQNHKVIDFLRFLHQFPTPFSHTENAERFFGETPSIPAGVRVVSVEQWRQYAYRRGISATDTTPRAQQRAFQRAVDQLVGSNRVAVWDDQVWTT